MLCVSLSRYIYTYIYKYVNQGCALYRLSGFCREQAHAGQSLSVCVLVCTRGWMYVSVWLCALSASYIQRHFVPPRTCVRCVTKLIRRSSHFSIRNTLVSTPPRQRLRWVSVTFSVIIIIMSSLWLMTYDRCVWCTKYLCEVALLRARRAWQLKQLEEPNAKPREAELEGSVDTHIIPFSSATSKECPVCAYLRTSILTLRLNNSSGSGLRERHKYQDERY